MVRYKYSQTELEEIKRIINLALASSNKTEARKHIKKLDYIAPDVAGPARYILIELSSAVDTACGKIQQESQIQMVKMSLCKLERFVEKI